MLRNTLFSSLAFLTVAFSSLEAFAVGPATIPASLQSSFTVDQPGNFMYRLNLSSYVGSGSDTCAFFYFE